MNKFLNMADVGGRELVGHQLFRGNGERMQEIENSYKQCLKFNHDRLGVLVLSDATVLAAGGWGCFFGANSDESEIALENGMGWGRSNYSRFQIKYPYNFQCDERSVADARDAGSLKKINSAVMLTFPGAFTFGHWIVDIIIRNHIFNIRSEIKNIDVEFYFLPGPLQAWMRPFIEFMNIPYEKIIELKNDDAYQVKQLYVPTIASHFKAGVLPFELCRQVFDDFKEFVEIHKTSTSTGLYRAGILMHTSLTSGADRNIKNVDALRQWGDDRGYLLIDPVGKGLVHTLSEINSCEFIIGQDSSALHNLAFVSKPLIVIESIKRNANIHASIQEINRSILTYVSCRKNSANEFTVSFDDLDLACELIASVE
jgi:hypothetical protein